MKPLDLLILVLATFYLSYAVAKTHGPYNIFATLRSKVPLGGLTGCIICLAFWVALLNGWLITTQVRTFVYVLAVAGGAILMYRYTGGEHVS